MEEQKMWDLFWEIHHGNPREGPGESHSTRRAFCMQGFAFLPQDSEYDGFMFYIGRLD
jgi:hypothetical protein